MKPGLGTALVILLVGLNTPLGWAKSKHVKKGAVSAGIQQVETYSATEDEDTGASAPVRIRPVKAKTAAAMKAPAPTPPPVKLVFREKDPQSDDAVPAPKAETIRTSFDPVASDQIENIAERLRLVELILKKHARAYDYRIHSVRELRGILARLEGTPRGNEAGTARPIIRQEGTLPPPSEPEVDVGALPDPDSDSSP